MSLPVCYFRFSIFVLETLKFELEQLLKNAMHSKDVCKVAVEVLHNGIINAKLAFRIDFGENQGT